MTPHMTSSTTTHMTKACREEFVASSLSNSGTLAVRIVGTTCDCPYASRELAASSKYSRIRRTGRPWTVCMGGRGRV